MTDREAPERQSLYMLAHDRCIELDHDPMAPCIDCVDWMHNAETQAQHAALEQQLADADAKLTAMRDEATALWGERDRWDADPIGFLHWLQGELVSELARGMRAEAQLAEAETTIAKFIHDETHGEELPKPGEEQR